MTDDRRLFNDQEHTALYIMQDGCCAKCGTELQQGWHADHINPWIRGGPTDVINGQALCPTCNLKKGDKVESIELREWQKQAKRQYHADGKPDWLACITPGGGKTKWALSIASDLLHAGTVERIIVVVPTDNLRTQWTKEEIVNLAIINNGDNAREPKPFQGCVVTYAQVASKPLLYRMWCSKFNTAVIFDEVHHAGDTQTWGKGLETAFEPAIRRISMTGTPWRAPRNGKIPFVKYDSDGKVICDYEFSYGKAVQAHPQVCRIVQFYPYDGSVTYLNIDQMDSCVPQTETVRLGEMEDDDSSILRDILRADGQWMPSILQKACATLEEIRLTVLDAKMLVVVHDRTEARAVAKLVKDMTNENPALIISDPDEDEPDPQKELDAFRKDQRKYVIAVDMVSEGVDIPPLYVCVYATRKKTPLRFQQIVGRVIRKRMNDDLPAVVFIPAIPNLMKLAGEIDTMITHFMDKEIDEVKKEIKDRQLPNHDMDPIALNTSEAIRIGAISSGTAYHENDLRIAEEQCIEYGIPAIFAPSVVKLLQAQGKSFDAPNNQSSSQNTQEKMSLQETWNRLRGVLDKEIGSVAGIIAQKNGTDIGKAKKDVNTRVSGKFNKKKRHELSLDELRDAIVYVRKIRETIRNGNEDESA